MIVLDQQKEKLNIDLIGLLASGVKILEVESFVESLCQKIPPAEVDRYLVNEIGFATKRSV